MANLSWRSGKPFKAQELWSDCLVSPDVFNEMVDRLGELIMPYQQALATEADPHAMHLYLQGLLSHLPRKNAEAIAAWVDVERQVLQDFIGIAPWDHQPLIGVLVGQVAKRLGEPDGLIVFDPSSFPKRGTHSVGVKRQWCGHRGKVDNSLLAFNALLWYFLFSVLCNHKIFLMSARLSRRFSCMVLQRLLLLHTVRMTWRWFPRFLT
jgi:SRSO17 transposase